MSRLSASLALCLALTALLLSGAAAARPLPLNPSLLVAGANSGKKDLNLRPLIGVLSQQGDPAPRGSSYIAASYIKFLESAGARVVPILCDMPKEEVKRRFNAVNGILLPGGAQVLRPGYPWYDTAAYLFELAKAENDKGTHFPLHGTCLGFEVLAVIASGNHSILSEFDAEDNASPLYPTEYAPKSKFFSSLPPQVYQHLQTLPYAMENHAHGLAWSALRENPAVEKFFNVLSLSRDRKGEVYVSTMEAKKYPIYATQWHPEKNAFEWTPDKHIPHHPDAIEVTQEVANFFVSEARKNFHAPASQAEEEELLIYNWPTSYTGKHKFQGEEVDFDESYFFPPAKELKRLSRGAHAGRSSRARAQDAQQLAVVEQQRGMASWLQGAWERCQRMVLGA